MTRKIFSSIFAAVVSILLLSFVVVTGVLYKHLSDAGRAQLKDELSLAAHGVEINGEDYLSTLSVTNYRLTWIAADGTVLYDTLAQPENMDNHIEREEIKEALENGSGESYRYSDTSTQETIYAACLLSDGTVLRISTGFDSVFVLLANVLVPMSFVLLMAIIVSVMLARYMAGKIVSPLNDLDLDNPTENSAYDELSPILTKLHKQHKQINRQMELLRQKTDEFEQITNSINEGLVLLNENGIVLSMNPAAKKLFGTDDCTNREFLTIDHTPDMIRAVKNAFKGKHCEFRMQRNGGEYQIGISRIESDGKTLGAVILCIDVTEAAFAERNRREFTANVSHELKTPLQSIIGSAELLENGLVRQEDMPRFFAMVKNEAIRLVTLINDIIRLSQIDENGEQISESVDLYDVAGEVIDTLSASAAKKNVSLVLNGESTVINGVRRYIYEIIYNLCDNAIRYNVDGGEVIIDIGSNREGTVISVADTGIGIAPEHHSRVFERFYRVDKSHSKETGGTGLGLSIVKHAVVYHGGRIELDSQPGRGTTIKIVF